LPRLADVGQFTILDPATVTEADIGCNFFLDPSSLGKPRAEQVVRFLLELNGDVKGHALVQVRSLALFLFIPWGRLLTHSLTARSPSRP